MSSSLGPEKKIKTIKIGPLVKQHEAFILDNTLHLSEEEFDWLMEYVDGMNLHVKVLGK